MTQKENGNKLVLITMSLSGRYVKQSLSVKKGQQSKAGLLLNQ